MPGEDIEIRNESLLSVGKCDSCRWIAQWAEHGNGNPRVPGSHRGTAVHFSDPAI